MSTPPTAATSRPTPGQAPPGESTGGPSTSDHPTPGRATETVMDGLEVAELPRRSLAPGVAATTLWSRGSSHAGVMRLEPGARLGAHTHRRHAHHIWMIEGSIHCLDRDLGEGSYVHVPPGLEHDSVAGSHGAAFFYLYLDTWEEPPVVPA